MQITGGKVIFARSVQPAQYETKKAEVEITFVLAEGENLGATLDTAASLAQNKALEMVGLQKSEATQARLTSLAASDAAAAMLPRTPATKEAAAAAMNAKEPAPPKPAKPPKVPKAEAKPDPAALDDDTAHAAKIAENTVKNGEARAISDTPDDRKEPEDLTDMLGGAEPMKEITDEDLTGAIMQHNAKIKNPTAIRQLIIKFVGKTPCQARDLPKERRAEFLEDLKKL